jgi:hypothetical protein
MMIVGKLGNYKVSRDYARLAELAKKESIICVVGEGVGKTTYEKYSSGTVIWEIRSQGICFLMSDNIAGFLRMCQLNNVEFIEPLRKQRHPEKSARIVKRAEQA